MILMNGLQPSGDSMIRQLYEAGVIKPDTASITASTKYTIPRIFRPGLNMVIKGRP